MQEAIPQFILKYEGRDADEHVLDAEDYGRSLIGAAKVYNVVAHYCVTGYVPKSNYRKQIVCYAKAPKEGSFEDIFFFVVASDQYGLFSDIVKESLGYLLFKIAGSAKRIWTGSSTTDETVQNLTEIIRMQVEKDHNLMEILANGLLAGNEKLADLHGKLIETLPDLADRTRNHARDLVCPIGKSCKELTQFAGTDGDSKIDEADAEAIRSTEDLEVKEMQTFRCEKIQELNLNTGHCELQIEGIDGIVTGKISDPILEQPYNVYTRAFDGQLSFNIQAKPVEKKGHIQKLFISDANL